MNGTAASASLASLVSYKTYHVAVLNQILTAVAVEALQGSAESFHPFIKLLESTPMPERLR